jgi:hypothetical protein
VANDNGELARARLEGKNPWKTNPQILERSTAPYRKTMRWPQGTILACSKCFGWYQQLHIPEGCNFKRHDGFSIRGPRGTGPSQPIEERPGSISCVLKLHTDDAMESRLKLGTERRRFGVVAVRAHDQLIHPANFSRFTLNQSPRISPIRWDIC